MGWLRDLKAGAKEAVRDARDPVVKECRRQERVAERVARIEEQPTGRPARRKR